MHKFSVERPDRNQTSRSHYPSQAHIDVIQASSTLWSFHTRPSPTIAASA
jgi:hypothetical protein